ncbi:hypothetical protein BDV96DRAFT_340641 [Lophiotrema nucula]|uniref:Uncharacterized protein n=1 Tax=Lophiotrema nucula TaxID=690887 RepID=A0A6A5ZI04_9PLEO|nr:hypothetical protein BDV96DRAFT_340641 [Lophiotrema nucula]
MVPTLIPNCLWTFRWQHGRQRRRVRPSRQAKDLFHAFWQTSRCLISTRLRVSLSLAVETFILSEILHSAVYNTQEAHLSQLLRAWLPGLSHVARPMARSERRRQNERPPLVLAEPRQNR